LLVGYLYHRDDAPPGHVWAAVRACRRALAADLRDPAAYLLLGEAYCRLAWNTEERAAGARVPALARLRRQQAVAALRHALEIRPDLEQAHSWLVALYQELGQLDDALRHVQALHDLQQARGPRPGEAPRQHADHLATLRRDADQLRRDVQARQDVYRDRQAGLDVAGRARLAGQLGLADAALTSLLGAGGEELGRDGVLLELELLLGAGRYEEGRAWLEPKHREVLGDVDYHWLGARFDAAAGDYAGADAHLRPLVVRSAAVPELGPRPVVLDAGLAVTAAANVLAGAQEAAAAHPLLTFWFSGLEPRLRLNHLARTLEQSVQFAVLQGVVALERGDARQARQHFRAARTLSGSDPALADLRSVARYYEQLLATTPNPEAR
jgi:tetratricopeptide (TPR) repeat protein